LESTLYAALFLDILIEFALDFPGWGAGFVQALQQQNPQHIAFSISTAGLMLGILCGLLHGIRPRAATPLSPAPASAPARTQPVAATLTTLAILVAAIGLLLVDSASPLHLQATQLTSGVNWLPALASDALACLGIIALALIGGPVLAALRLTILGDWLRRYGSLETLVWSPLPIWALAWSQGSGRVISIDLALSALAAVTLSIHLHSSVRHASASTLLLASRSLGATAWQAWCRHALRPWLRQFLAFLFRLFGFVWWLRIATHCLLTTDKTTPEASIGSFLAHAATDALHHPLPLLSASLAAAVSILFLWNLGRIIHDPQSDDA
jgi:hypothetical protein